MSSSNHPPPDLSAGGHFDLLRRATQKMMYKYVVSSLLTFESLSPTPDRHIPRARLPSLQTPLSRHTCSVRQTGLPCHFVLHLHYPSLSPWAHSTRTHTYIQFAIPLDPLSRTHCTSARSSSRTPFSLRMSKSVHPTSVCHGVNCLRP